MQKHDRQVTFLGVVCDVWFTRYPKTQQLAIILRDAHHDAPEDEADFCCATVNLPDVYFAPQQTAIKDWSENAGVLKALVDAGVVKYTGQWLTCGYAQAAVVDVVPEVPIGEREPAQSGDVKTFLDADTMFDVIGEQNRAAEARTLSWQRDLRPGDCYVEVVPGEPALVCGEIIESKYADDRRTMKAQPWLMLVRAGSVMCPETEMGSTYRCNVYAWVPRWFFLLYRAAGFVLTDDIRQELWAAMDQAVLHRRVSFPIDEYYSRRKPHWFLHQPGDRVVHALDRDMARRADPGFGAEGVIQEIVIDGADMAIRYKVRLDDGTEQLWFPADTMTPLAYGELAVAYSITEVKVDQCEVCGAFPVQIMDDDDRGKCMACYNAEHPDDQL